MRARGLLSKWLYVDIDGHRAASLRLNEDELKVMQLPTFKEPLEPGRHRITLRFPRAPRGVTRPNAEIDWLRVGGKDDPPSRYAAPTLSDVVSDVSLSNAPRRSFVLRGGSTLRCFIKPSRDAKLDLSLGVWGTGHGVAAIRVIRDSGPPLTLQTRRLNGGDAATWTPLELDLGPYDSEVIALELSALDATKGARVAFGDPVIVRKQQPLTPPPLAKTVVMVVLRRHRSLLPPWAATGQLTAFGELARTGISFSHYRAPSTVVSAVMATMLSGLPPRGTMSKASPTGFLRAFACCSASSKKPAADWRCSRPCRIRSRRSVSTAAGTCTRATRRLMISAFQSHFCALLAGSTGSSRTTRLAAASC